MTTERADWLEWRRGGLGASDVAGVIGLSPWSSPWSVWADKAGLLPDEDSEVMEFGRYAEAMIGPWVEDRLGVRVVCQQERVEDPRASWRRCTLDGRLVEFGPGVPIEVDEIAERTLSLLEMKTAAPGKNWTALPAHYQVQGQWQMATTDVDSVTFAVLMGRRLDLHILQRDEKDIALLLEHAERFWFDHVVTGIPPAVDASEATERALAAVYPKASPGSAVDVDDIVDVIDDWQTAKADVKAAKAAEKGLANEIRAVLGDHEEGTVGGERVVSWRDQHREPYTVEAADFRVLRYHKRKGSE